MKSQKILQMNDNSTISLAYLSDSVIQKEFRQGFQPTESGQKINCKQINSFLQCFNLFYSLLFMIIILLGNQVITYGQTPSQSNKKRSYYGAPVLKYTVIRNQGALMFGGRGCWNVTPSLVIGFGLYGTESEVNAPEEAVPNLPYSLDIKMENFTLELEYAFHPDRSTYLTLNTLLGGAAAHYMKNKTEHQEGETDFMFLLEPSVGVEQRISKWLHLNLAVSYRLVNGVDLSKLKERDLNGLAVTLAVKLGRF